METAATWLVLGILVVVAAAGLWVRRRAGHGGRSADTQEAATSVEEASGARTLLAVLTSESGDVRWDVEVAPASALKEGSWVDAPSDLAVEVARTLPEVAARNRLGDGSLVRLVNVSADELVEAKDGYRLGWARGRGGTAVRQARMEKVKAPPIISPGMVWAAASIVVGAHWQRVLSEQLEAIQTAVSGIRDVLDTQMNATLVAAMQRLREITALRGQRIDQALESDPRFADAETVFRTQLDLVEKRLQARPALTKHGGLRFADFETWLEGGPGDPGVVDLYASALRGFAVSLAYDQLRFEAHVAVGQAARAEVVLAHAEERASRMQRLTDELGDLLDSDSHPVEPPRSAPVIGAGKAERRRQRVAELTEQGQKLIDHTAQLLDAAGSAERELLVTGDGRVLARAPAPVTSPEAHAGRRSASPEAHAGRRSASPVDEGAAGGGSPVRGTGHDEAIEAGGGARMDRVIGTLLGLAAGDALGAGYEFQGEVAEQPRMRGGGLGGWAPGEWTDDTQMAVCIAEVTAAGSVDTTAIARRFLDWLAAGPADVGVQTRAVLTAAEGPEALAAAAADYYRRHPDRSAGNGSLMRTAPVALARLGDDEAIAARAREVSALTHGDPLAGDACVLWCIAIDRAVRQARLDGVRDGLGLLDPQARAFWEQRIDEAEQQPPEAFAPNGFVVTALQAAHAAITQTPVPEDVPCRHLVAALEQAVRIGDDTDTVAAIAGSLLGARWGASALPFAWRRLLHGWPGYRAQDLARLAVLTTRREQPDEAGWPTAASLVGHYGERPVAVLLDGDPGVLVGNLAGVAGAEVDAVVSLCRVGTEDVPAAVEHHEVFLIDQPDANPNLRFVVEDAAQAVAALRGEGKRVMLHCAGGRSRTPTVAAVYLAGRLGISTSAALERVRRTLPETQPNRTFRDLMASYDQPPAG